MGGSLRRHKKHKPRIVKKKSKKPHAKTAQPVELAEGRPDLQKKLGISPEWDGQEHLEPNYNRIGFVADANVGFGRNKRPDVLAEAAAQHPELLDAEPDDELKVACAQQRSSGRAPPRRLTAHQRQIVERLTARHGEDTRAMLMDRKLNPMQHPEAVLREMITSYRHWQPGSGVDFRVPNKRLW